MSAHTPGPWAIDWNVSRLDVFSADAATLVATIRRSALSAGLDDTAKANARLIASAPQLLEVCKELSECAEYWSEYDVPIGIVDRLNNAIKLAEAK
jgi:hypothetical protein